jgi:hypothetical protein
MDVCIHHAWQRLLGQAFEQRPRNHGCARRARAFERDELDEQTPIAVLWLPVARCAMLE